MVFAAAAFKVSCQRQWFCSPTFLLAWRLPRPPHRVQAPGGAGGSGGAGADGFGLRADHLVQRDLKGEKKGEMDFLSDYLAIARVF